MSFYFMHAFHNLKLCNVQCMQCTMVAYLCGPLYHLCSHTWKFIYSRKFKFFNIVNSWNLELLLFFFGENQKLQKGMQKFLLPDHFPYLAEVDILLWICDIELEIGSHWVFSSFFYKTNLCVSRFPLIQWWYSVFCFWQLPN